MKQCTGGEEFSSLQIPIPCTGLGRAWNPQALPVLLRIFLFYMLENKHCKNPYMPELPVRCLWSLLSLFVHERFMGHFKEVAVLL